MGNRKIGLPAIGIAFLLISIYVFIFSDSGVLMRMNLQRNRKALFLNIEKHSRENRRLRLVHEQYQNGKQDKVDILNAGYINPNDKLIFIKGIDEKAQGGDPKPQERQNHFELFYMQIIWFIISCLVMVLYFTLTLKGEWQKNEQY